MTAVRFHRFKHGSETLATRAVLKARNVFHVGIASGFNNSAQVRRQRRMRLSRATLELILPGQSYTEAPHQWFRMS